MTDPLADLMLHLKEEHESRLASKPPKTIALSTGEISLIRNLLMKHDRVIEAIADSDIVSKRAQQLTPVQADYLIMMAAFRYALGRSTYIVVHVTDWIEKNIDTIPAQDVKRMISEINDASEFGSIGMAMDDLRWKNLQDKLRQSLNGDQT